MFSEFSRTKILTLKLLIKSKTCIETTLISTIVDFIEKRLNV